MARFRGEIDRGLGEATLTAILDRLDAKWGPRYEEAFRDQGDKQGEGWVRSGSPPNIDEIDLSELLDAISDLIGWLRIATFDEEEGEREARDRALPVPRRYEGNAS